MIVRALLTLLAFVVVQSPSASASAQERIKVGYWTSGFSVGFGAVLEAGKFLEQQGLQPEWVRFSDVNGPTKAIITHSIDVAFAAPATGAFTLGAQGAPIEIVLATQVAEATFVAKDGSSLNSLSDLKGKKVGMSPAGSATYAIAAAVLERNYGLKTSDYIAVPGNEGQLVQYLQRGDIDTASLRAVTIASVPGLKLKILSKVVDEWKRMTKSNSVPILGVTIIHKDYAHEYPDGVFKFVRAVMQATEFGRREPEKVAAMLRQASNLDAKDATSYARLWDQIYIATMTPEDLVTLKTMAQIFRAGGTIEGTIPDSIYVTAPYEQAKRQP
jgi:ABC-type nitrate/sulfonate/bicarbonate transport system substrate-binding protein